MKTPHSYLVCVRNQGYEVSLEARKIYEVLPDEEAAQQGMVRVLDESGEDYLFPAHRFLPIELPAEVEEALLQVG
jgi:hypothetical protein